MLLKLGKLVHPLGKDFRTRLLPKEMREELKLPIGDLLTGKPEDNALKVRLNIDEKTPTMLATVGDFVTDVIIKGGMEPDIVIVDNRIMRRCIKPLKLEREKIRVTNRSGTISAEAWKGIYKAITHKRGLAIIVEGEEDLLVLPLMAMMPDSSIIIYGQPNMGMVVVNLTEERRSWALDFIGRMEEG